MNRKIAFAFFVAATSSVLVPAASAHDAAGSSVTKALVPFLEENADEQYDGVWSVLPAPAQNIVGCGTGLLDTDDCGECGGGNVAWAVCLQQWVVTDHE